MIEHALIEYLDRALRGHAPGGLHMRLVCFSVITAITLVGLVADILATSL
jgi:hypothetical protein